MVLTGLLIIAAVSLVLGVVLANVTWLIVSLVASVLAAFFLYRSWGAIKERRTNMARRKSPQSEPSHASPPPARAPPPGPGGRDRPPGRGLGGRRPSGLPPRRLRRARRPGAGAGPAEPGA